MSILKYFSRIEPELVNTNTNTDANANSKKIEKNELEVIPQTWIAYTDGSCFDNGKKGAVGGIGVYFNTDSGLENISEPLVVSNGNVTNNKCELEAVRRALLAITETKKFHWDDYIKIYTDSKYLVDSITKWSTKWAQNGWVRKGTGKGASSGGKVKNVELIKAVKNLCVKYNVDLKHCKAHTTFHGSKTSPEYKIWFGNKMADELAVGGSKMNMN